MNLQMHNKIRIVNTAIWTAVVHVIWLKLQSPSRGVFTLLADQRLVTVEMLDAPLEEFVK
jgi:hypothetical protein